MNIKIAPFLTFIFCLFSNLAVAQNATMGKISGKLIESGTSLPLEFAVVKLMPKKDSTQIFTVLTNKVGYFQFDSQILGSYTLKISFIGYESLSREVIITAEKPIIDLGRITLLEGIGLKTVNVTGIIAPISIKKDTLEYDARAFKTAPNANVEGLLKKVGGIDVDFYGNIKIHGLDLSKVTVEGKKFFGDNYKIATQNLPADAIAKIQVIESRTEESKISGIDDGKREKVINLVLKEDKKGGYFGSGTVGGGTSERYLTSGSINHFSKGLQVNLLLMSNNNNQAYSVGEAGSFSGNDFGKGAVSGEINGVAFGRISQGLTKTNSTALNFSKDWGKKTKNSFNIFYVGSLIDNESNVQSAIQNIQVDNTFLNNLHTVKQSENQSHSLSFYFNSTVDSLTSYNISPAFGLEKSNSISNVLTKTTNINGLPINNATQNLDNEIYRPFLDGSLTFRRKFRKAKGSYSFTLSHNYNKNSTDNFNVNNTLFYVNGAVNSNVSINQLQDNDNLNSAFTFRGQLSRVISKDKKTSLLGSASISNTLTNADQYTFDYNPLNGLYEIVVPEFTNVYENRLTKRDASVGVNRTNLKTTFIATANLQSITQNGRVIGSTINDIKRDYLAILPTVTFSYRTDSRKSFSVNLNSNLSVPAVTDLQPVQNNLNRFYIREGNPNLKPAKTYSAQLGYNTINVKTNRYANLSLNFTLFRDNISISNVFDEVKAISYLKPINVNGNYAMSVNAGFGGPIKKLKGISINYGLTSALRKGINYLNNLRNFTESISTGANASINYSFKDALFVSFSNRTNFIDTHNSVQEAVDNSYFNIANTANLNFELVKRWRLTADLNHQENVGRNDDFKQSLVLVNAGLQRLLMPKDQLVLELKGYDLFNQNSNISRAFTANRIEDTQSVNLRRYFLVKLTYKVNKIKSK